MLWPNHVLFGNTLLRWILAWGAAAALLAMAKLARRWLVPRLFARAERTGALPDICLANLAARTRWFCLLAIALYLGTQLLELPLWMGRQLDRTVPVVLILQVAAWGHWGIGLWIERRFQGAPAGASRLAVLGFILRLALWSLVLLVILDGLGCNITTLLASLGIGGIAVALAVQNVLGDLFASLSITLDQPFLIGDFIIVDDCLGTVRFIGLKTTRIQSLSGEQIIIANSDLLKCRVRNFKDMRERRVVFGFTLGPRTPEEQLARVPDRIRSIVEELPKTRFDRAHFKAITDAGLAFEVVYYVLDGDYNLYMDLQQAINLAILRGLRQDGVAFSFPARSLRLDAETGPAG